MPGAAQAIVIDRSVGAGKLCLLAVCRSPRLPKFIRKPRTRSDDKRSRISGSVTATVAPRGLPGKMADDDFVCPATSFRL